ncbi:hypothetical protein K438DRAFT_1554987, partial [Mycena galopus ATCC 62051]
PETPQELFNLRHSQLRNAVKRIFGVTKRQFPILILRPECSYAVQAKIVAAAGALRNFLCIHDQLNSFGFDVDANEEYDPDAHPFLAGAVIPEHRVLAITAEESKRANTRRERIMMSMWAQY